MADKMTPTHGELMREFDGKVERMWTGARDAMNNATRLPMSAHQEATCKNVFYAGMKSALTLYKMAQDAAQHCASGDEQAQIFFDDLMNSLESQIDDHALRHVTGHGGKH